MGDRDDEPRDEFRVTPCWACRYFVEDSPPVTGECRVLPPVVNPGSLRGFWPVVSRDGWCGWGRPVGAP